MVDTLAKFEVELIGLDCWAVAMVGSDDEVSILRVDTDCRDPQRVNLDALSIGQINEIERRAIEEAKDVRRSQAEAERRRKEYEEAEAIDRAMDAAKDARAEKRASK